MIGAIVQARMGSSRCPEKSLKDLCGKTLLERVIDRTQQCPSISKVVVATTVNVEDDKIEAFCKEKGVLCYRGSSDDVLDRYYMAAKTYGIDTIVRITADDPFKDPDVIEEIIHTFFQGHYDYASNTLKPTYPEGLDAEVFSFQSLERAWNEGSLPSEREHVTPYIWKNANKFRLINVTNSSDLSYLRWTIDHDEDFAFASEILRNLEDKNGFRTKDILAVLEKNPEIASINSGFVRNEGYLKSVHQENE